MTMLVIFLLAYVKRVRNGDTIQLRCESCRYQNVGRVLVL